MSVLLLQAVVLGQAREKILGVLDRAVPDLIRLFRTHSPKDPERAKSSARTLVEDLERDPVGWLERFERDPDRSGLAMIYAVARLAMEPGGIVVLGKTYETGVEG